MAKRLIDLNPELFSSGGEGVTNSITGEPIPRREGVGVEMDCPCGACGFRLYVPFRNPISEGPDLADRYGWQRTGETFETLTLTPSIQRMERCKWHGFLTNGILSDC